MHMTAYGHTVLLRCIGIAAVLAAMIGLARPQDFDAALEAAKAEYLANCANCHGDDGRGTGPHSTMLRTKPANLTLLAKKNHGVFPVSQVYQLIDGRGSARSHLSEEMPIWGCRQSSPHHLPPKRHRGPRNAVHAPTGGADLDSFMNLTCDPEQKIQQRIMSIVAYLSQIQAK